MTMSKSWVLSAERREAFCSDSDHGDCSEGRVLQGIDIPPIHDRELDDASKRINRILDEIRAHNQDPGRELAWLAIPQEHSNDTVLLLAWVRHGVSGDSSVDDINRVLHP